MIAVKRYGKLYRERGAKGFHEAKPRHSFAGVLKGEVPWQAQRMLDEGRSVPEVAAGLPRYGPELYRLPTALAASSSYPRLAAPRNPSAPLHAIGIPPALRLQAGRTRSQIGLPTGAWPP